MSEKPIAVILAGVGVVSLCAICVLGPAVIGAAAGWAFGWVADLSPMATTGIAIFTALLALVLFRRWGAHASRRKLKSAPMPGSVEGEHR